MKRKKSAKKNKLQIKPVLIFVLLAGVFFASTVWLTTNSQTKIAAAPTQNSQAFLPSQYSDMHITENAIVTDLKFKAIAIVDSTEAEQNLANVISAPKPTPPVTTTTPTESGTWLWTPILQITPQYENTIIAGAKKDGVHNIYVSIDSYLDVYVMPDGAEKTKLKKTFDNTLENFITLAHQNSMTVDAEGGWRNWAEPGNTYKAFAIVNYAIDFNKTHTEKLRGFQYDVEPYLLDNYAKNKTEVLKNFVSLVNGTVAMMKSSDLQLSVVIPEFYDGQKNSDDESTPTFTYAGKTSDTLTHLLDVLDQRTNSKLVVMAYRNFSTGENGSIAISTDEIDDANKYNTKVVIAAETGDVTPPYVTFHNTSKKYYDKQVATIEQTFSHDKSFGGIATHYINAYMALK